MSVSENFCNHCGGQDLIKDEETGEIICSSCGLVVSKINLVGRTFIEERLHSTSQKMVKSSVDNNINRLMILDRRIKSEEEDPYVLRVAINEIQRLVQSIHLPETIEKNAEKIYKNAKEKGLVTRGTITGFAAAAVYASCRIQGLPWTLQQISDASSENLKDISRMYRILLYELNLSVELDNPLKHLSSIASSLNISHKSERLAEAILEQMMENSIHLGKNPKGLAASAIYVACKLIGDRCTQQNLSDIAGISVLTIRKRVKEINQKVNIKKLLEIVPS